MLLCSVQPIVRMVDRRSLQLRSSAIGRVVAEQSGRETRSKQRRWPFSLLFTSKTLPIDSATLSVTDTAVADTPTVLIESPAGLPAASSRQTQGNESALRTLNVLCPVTEYSRYIREEPSRPGGIQQFHASLLVRGVAFTASGTNKKAALQIAATQALEKVFKVRVDSLTGLPECPEMTSTGKWKVQSSKFKVRQRKRRRKEWSR